MHDLVLFCCGFEAAGTHPKRSNLYFLSTFTSPCCKTSHKNVHFGGLQEECGIMCIKLL